MEGANLELALEGDHEGGVLSGICTKDLQHSACRGRETAWTRCIQRESAVPACSTGPPSLDKRRNLRDNNMPQPRIRRQNVAWF
jgi:hypothetical protein